MDEGLVIQTNQAEVKKGVNALAVIGLIVAILAILAAAGIWYFTNRSMTQKINELTVKMESEIGKIQKENSALKDMSAALTDQIGALKDTIWFNAIAHDIEGAAVTDDFVVEKVYLTGSDSGTLGNVIIDVENQPDLSYLYKDKGAYNLTDRELRAKCDAIIKEVTTRYGNYEGIPAWDDNTQVTVTVKNYEIGSKGGKGEFKLVGETK